MRNSRFATLPPPPYYVVAYSSQKIEEKDGYTDMADAIGDLARQ